MTWVSSWSMTDVYDNHRIELFLSMNVLQQQVWLELKVLCIVILLYFYFKITFFFFPFFPPFFFFFCKVNEVTINTDM